MDNFIEVYREPAASGYGSKRTYGPDGRIPLAALPGVSLAAAEIF